ncbi:MAG: Holliday junction resolvase Hjc [Candidatus Micrarchaeota archaeon]|nr:Holliday junction resolvase Hjc [Candidatus Micrarchaeota archaeon]
MAFRTYAKGAKAERELIAYFSKNGFAVIRAAGSGVNSLSPDILAFRRGVQYAIECKSWDKASLSFEKRRVEAMKRWEELTGITYLVGWRISREGWLFFPIHLLEEQERSFTITLGKARLAGRKLEELVRQ